MKHTITAIPKSDDHTHAARLLLRLVACHRPRGLSDASRTSSPTSAGRRTVWPLATICSTSASRALGRNRSVSARDSVLSSPSAGTLPQEGQRSSGADFEAPHLKQMAIMPTPEGGAAAHSRPRRVLAVNDRTCSAPLIRRTRWHALAAPWGARCKPTQIPPYPDVAWVQGKASWIDLRIADDAEPVVAVAVVGRKAVVETVRRPAGVGEEVVPAAAAQHTDPARTRTRRVH
jgi:hypothetical protein